MPVSLRPTVPPLAPPAPAPTRTRSLLLPGLVLAYGGLLLWRGLATPHTVAGAADAGLTTWFGLDRWAQLGRGWAIPFAAVAAVAGITVARRPAAAADLARRVVAALDRRAVRLAVAAGSVAVFWLLSDTTENIDGAALQAKFEASPGGFATHDEMLELFLHSRLWAVLHAVAGWDVAQTYRMVSCVAGGVAVLVMIAISRRFAADRRLLVLGLLGTGGWVLVFFGDVENYTLLAVVGLGFLALGLRDGPVWPAGALLGLGVLCHLEALVLAPALLVLVWRRRAHRVDAAAALLAVPVLLGLGLWWFDRHGLPISDLVSHSQVSAQGGDWSAFLFPVGAQGWWLQLTLLVLLAPAVLLLPAVRTWDPFLVAAAAGGLVLLVVWRAQLGVFEDWNLYAIAAPSLLLLVATGLPRRHTPWLVGFTALAALSTLAWVLGNHA